MQLISFGGKQLFRPGAYSVVNLKTNTPASTGAFKVLAVVGSGSQGRPAYPIYANDPGVAARIIGGSDAVVMGEVAWDHGADLVCFMLTDKATQATYAIMDTTAGTALTIATLKGKRWNAADNQLETTVSAPSSAKQTVTLTDKSVTPNVVETYTVDNTTAGWASFVAKVNNESALVEAYHGTDGNPVAGVLAVAATVAATAFTGGTRTAADATSIAAAIDALKTEDIQGVLTTLTDSTTLGAIQTHVTTMSNVTSRRERRAFIGQPVGTSAAGYATAMDTYRNSRITLAAPGHYRAVGGAKVLLSSAFTAGAIAGRWAGKQNPNDPVTGDFIVALGLEYVWIDEIQDLVKAQVTVVEAVPRVGYQVLHALTGDPDLYELSVADIVDVTTRAVREELQRQFMGPGYNNIVPDMIQFVTSRLEEYKKQNWLVDGTDAFGQPLPAYRNVSVTKNGKAYAVTYEIKPSEPVNYILITALVNL